MKIKRILILPLFFTLFGNSAFSGEQKMLLENEKNTIGVFQKNVRSVVNVSNIQIARRGVFDFNPMAIPAGAGSGFIWDKEGHIVTNYHVIANGDSFLVSFHKEKKQYKAKVVGVEPKKDIAVLKLVELPSNLSPIQTGSSQALVVGQKAIAIGNPFGLDHSISSGIISALERKIDGIGNVKIHGMIQTDSSINPGNSGGPLLNSSGKLIGMNTIIFSGSGSSSGVGFAVPSDTIKRIVPQLIKYGKTIRPGLGVGIAENRIKDLFGIKEGIIIKYIDEKSPAFKVGLKGMGRDRQGRYYIGDVILEIDGKKINSFDDIYHVLDQYKVGQSIELKYLRGGKIKKVQLVLSQL
ncbi:MAG: trypsin-like serine protease [Halobacteriovoraceae bacterium]|nr:trypsin-like serine protease [Halobacteriovoraceae bacterium]